MYKRNELSSGRVFLGIEAGGTRTVAIAIDRMAGAGEPSAEKRLETGPANLLLVSDEQLRRHLQEIANSMPRPLSVAIGMAGARTESDRARILKQAARVWPGVPCDATSDLEIALVAAGGRGRRAEIRGQRSEAQVLVLSGTGSCCFGRTPDGKRVRVGGWGHILGDKGSGYEIGLLALKGIIYHYDREGVWSSLGERILRALHFNEPEDLIGWVQTASKKEVAALAVEVFHAAAKQERIARAILTATANSLARDGVACARRLVKPGAAVQFVLAGSVLLKQPRFAGQVRMRLRKHWPSAIVTRLQRESVWGAVELARQLRDAEVSSSGFRVPSSESGLKAFPQMPLQESSSSSIFGHDEGQAAGATRSLILSPTEQRNPRSMNLDRLPLGKAIVLMLKEDEKIPSALLRERSKIERAVELIVRALRRGGRLFYVGAGTSGRLGVLDASECPPTFGTPPEMVQGIIAGGQRALWDSQEGGEDDSGAGAGAIRFRGVGRRDVVVGTAASGRTPFVWGALREARSRGAKTVLLCFNPNLEIPRERRPHLVIAPNVGPEVLTGSTRLKAGTATKLILNIFTTLAMVRLGKVVSNLMVDVKASNTKLRDRATRIVQELTGVDYAAARAVLERAGWAIEPALELLKARRVTYRHGS